MSFEHIETNLSMENEYPKLVRDKIPEIIKINEGISVPTRILTDDTVYLEYLLRKIKEEAED
jgi:predicted house-cleaning noncanonical NTP pyrophosphatase (MazG superfamily)